MQIQSAFLIWLLSLTSVAHAAEVFVLENQAASADAYEQHTRTLAASCAACHGTNGNAVTSGNEVGESAVLAGIDATYFTQQMLAFKNGSRASSVMHHHAKGLKADEINALAVYFSLQNRTTAPPLKPQTLKASHD